MLSQILVAGVLFKELRGWRGAGQVAVFLSGVVLLVGAGVTMTYAQMVEEAGEIERLLDYADDAEAKSSRSTVPARDVSPRVALGRATRERPDVMALRSSQ